MAKQKFSPRKSGMFLDGIHVLLGLSVIVLAVFAVSNPGKYRFLFPVIFFLASVINFFTARFEYLMYPRDRKKLVSAVIYAVTGLLMFALFIISAISIWGNS